MSVMHFQLSDVEKSRLQEKGDAMGRMAEEQERSEDVLEGTMVFILTPLLM